MKKQMKKRRKEEEIKDSEEENEDSDETDDDDNEEDDSEVEDDSSSCSSEYEEEEEDLDTEVDNDDVSESEDDKSKPLDSGIEREDDKDKDNRKERTDEKRDNTEERIDKKSDNAAGEIEMEVQEIKENSNQTETVNDGCERKANEQSNNDSNKEERDKTGIENKLGNEQKEMEDMDNSDKTGDSDNTDEKGSLGENESNKIVKIITKDTKKVETFDCKDSEKNENENMIKMMTEEKECVYSKDLNEDIENKKLVTKTSIKDKFSDLDLRAGDELEKRLRNSLQRTKSSCIENEEKMNINAELDQIKISLEESSEGSAETNAELKSEENEQNLQVLDKDKTKENEEDKKIERKQVSDVEDGTRKNKSYTEEKELERKEDLNIEDKMKKKENEDEKIDRKEQANREDEAKKKDRRDEELERKEDLNIEDKTKKKIKSYFEGEEFERKSALAAKLDKGIFEMEILAHPTSTLEFSDIAKKIMKEVQDSRTEKSARSPKAKSKTSYQSTKTRTGLQNTKVKCLVAESLNTDPKTSSQNTKIRDLGPESPGTDSKTSSQNTKTGDLGPESSNADPKSSSQNKMIRDLGPGGPDIDPKIISQMGRELGPESPNTDTKTSSQNTETRDLGPESPDIAPKISSQTERELGPESPNTDPKTSSQNTKTKDMGPESPNLDPKTSSQNTTTKDMGPETPKIDPKTSSQNTKTRDLGSENLNTHHKTRSQNTETRYLGPESPDIDPKISSLKGRDSGSKNLKTDPRIGSQHSKAGDLESENSNKDSRDGSQNTKTKDLELENPNRELRTDPLNTNTKNLESSLKVSKKSENGRENENRISSDFEYCDNVKKSEKSEIESEKISEVQSSEFETSKTTKKSKKSGSERQSTSNPFMNKSKTSEKVNEVTGKDSSSSMGNFNLKTSPTSAKPGIDLRKSTEENSEFNRNEDDVCCTEKSSEDFSKKHEESNPGSSTLKPLESPLSESLSSGTPVVSPDLSVCHLSRPDSSFILLTPPESSPSHMILPERLPTLPSASENTSLIPASLEITSPLPVHSDTVSLIPTPPGVTCPLPSSAEMSPPIPAHPETTSPIPAPPETTSPIPASLEFTSSLPTPPNRTSLLPANPETTLPLPVLPETNPLHPSIQETSPLSLEPSENNPCLSNSAEVTPPYPESPDITTSSTSLHLTPPGSVSLPPQTKSPLSSPLSKFFALSSFNVKSPSNKEKSPPSVSISKTPSQPTTPVKSPLKKSFFFPSSSGKISLSRITGETLSHTPPPPPPTTPSSSLFRVEELCGSLHPSAVAVGQPLELETSDLEDRGVEGKRLRDQYSTDSGRGRVLHYDALDPLTAEGDENKYEKGISNVDKENCNKKPDELTSDSDGNIHKSNIENAQNEKKTLFSSPTLLSDIDSRKISAVKDDSYDVIDDDDVISDVRGAHSYSQPIRINDKSDLSASSEVLENVANESKEYLHSDRLNGKEDLGNTTVKDVRNTTKTNDNTDPESLEGPWSSPQLAKVVQELVVSKKFKMTTAQAKRRQHNISRLDSPTKDRTVVFDSTKLTPRETLDNRTDNSREEILKGRKSSVMQEEVLKGVTRKWKAVIHHHGKFGPSESVKTPETDDGVSPHSQLQEEVKTSNPSSAENRRTSSKNVKLEGKKAPAPRNRLFVRGNSNLDKTDVSRGKGQRVDTIPSPRIERLCHSPQFHKGRSTAGSKRDVMTLQSSPKQSPARTRKHSSSRNSPQSGSPRPASRHENCYLTGKNSPKITSKSLLKSGSPKSPPKVGSPKISSSKTHSPKLPKKAGSPKSSKKISSPRINSARIAKPVIPQKNQGQRSPKASPPTSCKRSQNSHRRRGSKDSIGKTSKGGNSGSRRSSTSSVKGDESVKKREDETPEIIGALVESLKPATVIESQNKATDLSDLAENGKKAKMTIKIPLDNKIKTDVEEIPADRIDNASKEASDINDNDSKSDNQQEEKHENPESENDTGCGNITNANVMPIYNFSDKENYELLQENMKVSSEPSTPTKPFKTIRREISDCRQRLEKFMEAKALQNQHQQRNVYMAAKVSGKLDAEIIQFFENQQQKPREILRNEKIIKEHFKGNSKTEKRSNAPGRPTSADEKKVTDEDKIETDISTPIETQENISASYDISNKVYPLSQNMTNIKAEDTPEQKKQDIQGKVDIKNSQMDKTSQNETTKPVVDDLIVKPEDDNMNGDSSQTKMELKYGSEEAGSDQKTPDSLDESRNPMQGKSNLSSIKNADTDMYGETEPPKEATGDQVTRKNKKKTNRGLDKDEEKQNNELNTEKGNSEDPEKLKSDVRNVKREEGSKESICDTNEIVLEIEQGSENGKEGLEMKNEGPSLSEIEDQINNERENKVHTEEVKAKEMDFKKVTEKAETEQLASQVPARKRDELIARFKQDDGIMIEKIRSIKGSKNEKHLHTESEHCEHFGQETFNQENRYDTLDEYKQCISGDRLHKEETLPEVENIPGNNNSLNDTLTSEDRQDTTNKSVERDTKTRLYKTVVVEIKMQSIKPKDEKYTKILDSKLDCPEDSDSLHVNVLSSDKNLTGDPTIAQKITMSQEVISSGSCDMNISENRAIKEAPGESLEVSAKDKKEKDKPNIGTKDQYEISPRVLELEEFLPKRGVHSVHYTFINVTTSDKGNEKLSKAESNTDTEKQTQNLVSREKTDPSIPKSLKETSENSTASIANVDTTEKPYITVTGKTESRDKDIDVSVPEVVHLECHQEQPSVNDDTSDKRTGEVMPVNFLPRASNNGGILKEDITLHSQIEDRPTVPKESKVTRKPLPRHRRLTKTISEGSFKCITEPVPSEDNISYFKAACPPAFKRSQTEGEFHDDKLEAAISAVNNTSTVSEIFARGVSGKIRARSRSAENIRLPSLSCVEITNPIDTPQASKTSAVCRIVGVLKKKDSREDVLDTMSTLQIGNEDSHSQHNPSPSEIVPPNNANSSTDQYNLDSAIAQRHLSKQLSLVKAAKEELESTLLEQPQNSESKTKFTVRPVLETEVSIPGNISSESHIYENVGAGLSSSNVEDNTGSSAEKSNRLSSKVMHIYENLSPLVKLHDLPVEEQIKAQLSKNPTSEVSKTAPGGILKSLQTQDIFMSKVENSVTPERNGNKENSKSPVMIVRPLKMASEPSSPMRSTFERSSLRRKQQPESESRVEKQKSNYMKQRSVRVGILKKQKSDITGVRLQKLHYFDNELPSERRRSYSIGSEPNKGPKSVSAEGNKDQASEHPEKVQGAESSKLDLYELERRCQSSISTCSNSSKNSAIDKILQSCAPCISSNTGSTMDLTVRSAVHQPIESSRNPRARDQVVDNIIFGESGLPRNIREGASHSENKQTSIVSSPDVGTSLKFDAKPEIPLQSQSLQNKDDDSQSECSQIPKQIEEENIFAAQSEIQPFADDTISSENDEKANLYVSFERDGSTPTLQQVEAGDTDFYSDLLDTILSVVDGQDAQCSVESGTSQAVASSDIRECPASTSPNIVDSSKEATFTLNPDLKAEYVVAESQQNETVKSEELGSVSPKKEESERRPGTSDSDSTASLDSELAEIRRRITERFPPAPREASQASQESILASPSAVCSMPNCTVCRLQSINSSQPLVFNFDKPVTSCCCEPARAASLSYVVQSCNENRPEVFSRSTSLPYDPEVYANPLPDEVGCWDAASEDRRHASNPTSVQTDSQLQEEVIEDASPQASCVEFTAQDNSAEYKASNHSSTATPIPENKPSQDQLLDNNPSCIGGGEILMLLGIIAIISISFHLQMFSQSLFTSIVILRLL
ncbi:hypothetical protein SK128_003384 [Halocaridina rubra]|uniref:Uncharacterized protein n=1 Tax=Halocaridina rubra TaxID=373956 RepID=A0AAN8WEQ5_HALRR